MALSHNPRDRQGRHGGRDRAFCPISGAARLPSHGSKDQDSGDHTL